ncbi:MAG: VWA domain-containing protein, partial [Bryobacterales bacterium]|nr:VWA domain-containing protein [Bryobacterales bacterium]
MRVRLLLGTLFLSAVGVAQSLRPALRAESQLVLIPMTVLDREDRIVESLGSRHIRIFEEGKERAVASLSLEEGPVSLVVVLDVSRSMKKSLPDAVRALERLAARQHSEDEYALITFRDRPQLRLPFPASAAQVAGAAEAEQPEGSTALYDAMVLAVNHLRKGRHPSKAILVFSDGQEVSSRYRAAELRQTLREAGAPVYAFLLPAFTELSAWEDLRRLIEETGGRLLSVPHPRDFPDI